MTTPHEPRPARPAPAARPDTRRLNRLARLGRPRSTAAARTPFVLLVVALLASGMLGLLFLNASLNEGSFELTELRHETQELTDEEQELQAEVDAFSAPEALAERARELGMVPGGPPAFLNPDGSVLGEPSQASPPPPDEDEQAEDQDQVQEQGQEEEPSAEATP